MYKLIAYAEINNIVVGLIERNKFKTVKILENQNLSLTKT